MAMAPLGDEGKVGVGVCGVSHAARDGTQRLAFHALRVGAGIRTGADVGVDGRDHAVVDVDGGALERGCAGAVDERDVADEKGRRGRRS